MEVWPTKGPRTAWSGCPGAAARAYLGQVGPEPAMSHPGPRVVSCWHVPEPTNETQVNPQLSTVQGLSDLTTQFRESPAIFCHSHGTAELLLFTLMDSSFMMIDVGEVGWKSTR